MCDIVNTVRGVLEQAWKLRVVCGCMTQHTTCVGTCCTTITMVMGHVLVRQPGGQGIAFVEPSALNRKWSLRLKPSLLTLHRAYKGYLGAIFTGVLKNGLPWTQTWISRSCLAAAGIIVWV